MFCAQLFIKTILELSLLPDLLFLFLFVTVCKVMTPIGISGNPLARNSQVLSKRGVEISGENIDSLVRTERSGWGRLKLVRWTKDSQARSAGHIHLGQEAVDRGPRQKQQKRSGVYLILLIKLPPSSHIPTLEVVACIGWNEDAASATSTDAQDRREGVPECPW